MNCYMLFSADLQFTRTMPAAAHTMAFRNVIASMMATARKGILLIPGIRLCERSTWRKSGFMLHFPSSIRLCVSKGGVSSDDVMAGNAVEFAMTHTSSPMGRTTMLEAVERAEVANRQI